MSVYIPSFSEILAVSHSRGALSEAPELWDGLVGWWPMQEGGGGTAYDLSGRGNDGTLTNMDPATDWVTGEMGHALDFDGADDYLLLANNLVTTNPVTLSAWIYPRTAGETAGRILDNGSLSWYIDGATNKVGLFGGSITLSNSTVSYGAWNHVSVTVAEDGVCAFFKNGKPVGTGDCGDPGAGTASRIGNNSSQSRSYDGVICLFYAAYRLLQPSEISRLYSDPWAMGRLRPRVFAVSGGAPPTFGGSNQIIGAGLLGGQGV